MSRKKQKLSITCNVVTSIAFMIFSFSKSQHRDKAFNFQKKKKNVRKSWAKKKWARRNCFGMQAAWNICLSHKFGSLKSARPEIIMCIKAEGETEENKICNTHKKLSPRSFKIQNKKKNNINRLSWLDFFYATATAALAVGSLRLFRFLLCYGRFFL